MGGEILQAAHGPSQKISPKQEKKVSTSTAFAPGVDNVTDNIDDDQDDDSDDDDNPDDDDDDDTGEFPHKTIFPLRCKRTPFQ